MTAFSWILNDEDHLDLGIANGSEPCQVDIPDRALDGPDEPHDGVVRSLDHALHGNRCALAIKDLIWFGIQHVKVELFSRLGRNFTVDQFNSVTPRPIESFTSIHAGNGCRTRRDVGVILVDDDREGFGMGECRTKAEGGGDR